MVQHPAVADVSKALWSFASPSQVKVLPGLSAAPDRRVALGTACAEDHPMPCQPHVARSRQVSGAQVFLDIFPQLVGTRYGDLVPRFSDGLVLGLLNRRSGACDIAPPAETLVSRQRHPHPPANLPAACVSWCQRSQLAAASIMRVCFGGGSSAWCIVLLWRQQGFSCRCLETLGLCLLLLSCTTSQQTSLLLIRREGCCLCSNLKLAADCMYAWNCVGFLACYLPGGSA